MLNKATFPNVIDEATIAFRESVLNSFVIVDDPRTRKARVLHKLGDILFMTLCAVICGANNVQEVATYARGRKEWFAELLSLDGDVPSYGTFWMVLATIDPIQFQQGFFSWVGTLSSLTKGEVVAIDGKALRGTAEKGHPHSFVNIVSVWACNQGLTLGQVKVDGKSNEITAIPKLLSWINVKDSIVTIDAMGTQVAIAEQIQSSGGDYVLALKGNHSNMHFELKNYFNQAEKAEFEGVEHTRYKSTDTSHGRVEERIVYATEDIDWLPDRERWAGLRSIVLVISKRTCNEKTSLEKRLYITSLSAEAGQIAHAIRSHWRIENQCHWVLDLAFREDAQQACVGHIAENLAVIRRMALNLLKQDKTVKGGIELKRKKAGWEPSYLCHLVGIKFS